MSTMVPERSSSTIPHYCPHPGCKWSFVGSQKKADGFLAVHIRIVHKGVDPRPPIEETPARPAVRPAASRVRRGDASTAEEVTRQNGGAESAESRSGEVNDRDRSVDAPPGRACKTEGCPNAANTRYDRGVYVGLCAEVCIPRRRAEVSADGVRRIRASRAGAEATTSGEAGGSGVDSAATKPAEVEPPASPGAGASAPPPRLRRQASLTDLIGMASRGRREFLEAEGRYLEQLRLLRRHPDYERVAPVIHDAVERL